MKTFTKIAVFGAALAIGLVTSSLFQKQQPQAPVVVTLSSGLIYIDEREGTGPYPSQNQIVVTHYVGFLENGRKFDSSYDRGQPSDFRFGVGHVIAGWDEGLATMRVGGKRKLIIPPALAYGARGLPGYIPPNSTLIFDVELLDIR